MGIVIRQSFWGTVVTYLGATLGYISSLIVFPLFLDVHQIGLVRLVQSNALMLAPIAIIGLPNVWIQKFPSFKNDRSKVARILSLQLFSVLSLNGLILLGLQVFHKQIAEFFAEKSGDYIPFIFLSFVILISQSLFEIFVGYFRSCLNIVVPGYFKEVHLRLINILIIFCYGYAFIDFHQTLQIISLNYVLATIFLGVTLSIKYKQGLRLDFFKLPKSTFLEFFRLGGYFTILMAGGSIVLNITFLFVSRYLGLEANGVFATCLYIATVIELPYRATIQIATPFISEFFYKNDINGLQNFYSKVSVNLFLLGSLLFLGIVTNLSDLFDMVPKGETFKEGTSVVLVIGISKVLSMTFGVAGELFAYSQFKKQNVVMVLIVAGSAFLANIIFIPHFGLEGAAISFFLITFISLNCRFIYLLIKLNLNPLNWGHLKVLIIAISTSLLLYWWPLNFSPLLNIVVRSLATSVWFLSLAYAWRVSAELNNTANNTLRKLGIWPNRHKE
ncbi:MAG: hypothetical protein KI790_18925 [Cyclobacteriaceae bacterium]|nr:hypothetical protein [Cyclobacteriaceae bacterium HetDA_MAG_MS6]